MFYHKTSDLLIHLKAKRRFTTKPHKNHALENSSHLVYKYIIEPLILLLLAYSSVWNVKLHFLHTHALHMNCILRLLRSDAIIKDFKSCPSQEPAKIKQTMVNFDLFLQEQNLAYCRVFFFGACIYMYNVPLFEYIGAPEVYCNIYI